MITTLISVGLSVAVFFLLMQFFGLIASIIPALLVLIISYILISRQIAKKLESQMKDLQKELMKGHTNSALEKLKTIKKQYGRWQFFLSSTIDGQIGSIYYMKNQFARAKPYLENAFVRHWVAKAMLACIYYRERKFDEMNKTFDNLTRVVKKSGLLWSLWAYCVWRNGSVNKAINILSKGKKYLGNNDPHLLSNLRLLQNQKRMKMKGYGEQWYQFQLEVSPSQQMMRQGRVRFKNR